MTPLTFPLGTVHTSIITPLDPLLEGLQLIQNEPIYANFARWVKPSELKQELLFGEPMIVVEEDFEGTVPLNFITRTDFNKCIDLLSKVEKGEGALLIDQKSSPTWKEKVLGALKLLMTRPTSRECIFEVLKQLEIKGGRIEIREHTESKLDDQINHSYIIQLSLEHIVCSTLTKEGDIAPLEMPLHIVLIHEIIHANHALEDNLLNQWPPLIRLLTEQFGLIYENGVYNYIPPEVDSRYDTLEEAWTIEGLANLPSRFTENAVRVEFGYKKRFSHHDYSDLLEKEPKILELLSFEHSLIIALYRNEQHLIQEILKCADPISLICEYFHALTPALATHPFSLEVMKSLTDEDFDNFKPQYSFPNSFAICLLESLKDPSFHKSREIFFIKVLLNALQHPKAPSAWKTAAIDALKNLIDRVSFEELRQNRDLKESILFLALLQKSDEPIDALLKQRCSLHQINRCMSLIESSGDLWLKRDELTIQFLKKLKGRHLPIFENHQFLFSFPYVRDHLLKLSKDREFTLGKEKELATFWTTILSISCEELSEISSLDIHLYLEWRKVHQSEILTVLDHLNV